MEQLNREPTEEGNRSGSLALIDLENLIQDNKEFESGGSGLVSPRELTKINFRSLIGHTDEVQVFNNFKDHCAEKAHVPQNGFSFPDFLFTVTYSCMKFTGQVNFCLSSPKFRQNSY